MAKTKTKEPVATTELWDVIKANITALCDLRNVTELQLCNELGVSRNYFRKPRTDISLTKLLKIAKVLDAEPQNLWDIRYADIIKIEALNVKIETLTKERDRRYAELTPDEIMTPPLPFEDVDN